MKRPISTVLALSATAGLAFVAMPAANAATAKAGAKCTKLGEVKNGLTCVAKGKSRVYAAAAAATTTVPAASSGAAATPAPAAGLANVPGFDGKAINVGYLGNVSVNAQFPASASFATGGKSLTAGYNAAMSRLNDNGGIAKKYKVNTVFKETYYTPSEVVKGYAEIKNNVVMIGQIYGTPQAQVLSKSLAEDNLVGSPISLDSAWVNDPSMLPVGSTYQAQAINLLDWYVKDGGGAGKTVCAISLANNAYGNAGEAGFDYGVAQLKLKVGTKIKTSTNPAAASALKAAGCEGIVATISGEAQTPGLLSEMAKLDYFPTILALGPSFAVTTVVPSNSVAFQKQVIVATDNSQFGDEKIPGMKAFMSDIRKYAPQEIGTPNAAAIWGWVQARTVIALLEKAVANNDLSKAGMRNALATLGKVDNEGIFPNWNYVEPAKRVGPSADIISGVDISVPGGLIVKKTVDSAAAQSYRPAA
jgi:Periplasmic binding protein